MAKKTIRRTQVIAPFGVGSLLDFPGQSLLSAGLDVWPENPQCPVYDERLANRLGVQYFRSPPPAPQIGQQGNYLPFVRFPLWHFCPRCRALGKTSWNESSPPKCDSPLGLRFKPKEGQKPQPTCSQLIDKKRWRMIPVRFIVACENGHLEDFPWVEWVHTKAGKPLDIANSCSSPKLRLNYTGKAGLMGLLVTCENCNKHRSLMGSAGPNSLIGYQCTGNRPWLGPQGREQCNPNLQPRMLQRGATNLYFPKTANAILIPPFSNRLRALIDDRWSFLSSGVQADGTPDEFRLQSVSELFSVDLDSLREVVKQKLNGIGVGESTESEEEFRYSEYRALLSSQTDINSEFVTAPQNIDKYDELVNKFFSNITLVEKLAETRALTGFSRINPPAYREYDKNDQAMLSQKPQQWLPAIRVYGEGIFFTLNHELVKAWETSEAINRYGDIIQNYTQICLRIGREPRHYPPKYFLLHSLSHMLIRRLSFECGYGSSSLCERIYCWEQKGSEMSGVLIYTAAGDSEGTMGGLVQQGKPGNFEKLIYSAIYDAIWCSSDPLCIESHGQGIDSLNRAACHACTLLPETSCEEGNRFLDRAALIGSPNIPSLGYFGEVAEEILAGRI